MKKIPRHDWFYTDECHALAQLASIEKYLRDSSLFYPRIAFEAAMWEIACAKCRVYQTFELVK